MPASRRYRYLTCDEDGMRCEWRTPPVYVAGRWEREPGQRRVPCRIVSRRREDKLVSLGVRLPAPGGIVDMEGAE